MRILYPPTEVDIGYFLPGISFSFNCFSFTIRFISSQRKTLTCTCFVSVKSFLRKATICIDAADTDTSGVCYPYWNSCIRFCHKMHFFRPLQEHPAINTPKNRKISGNRWKDFPQRRTIIHFYRQQIFLSNFTDISYINSEAVYAPK